MEFYVRGEHVDDVRAIEGAEGRTLLSILRGEGIWLDAPCNGRGSCGRCRVRYEAGAPEPSEKELRLLKAEEIGSGIRLACASAPVSGSRIVLPEAGIERIYALGRDRVPEAGQDAPEESHGTCVPGRNGILESKQDMAEESPGTCVPGRSGIPESKQDMAEESHGNRVPGRNGMPASADSSKESVRAHVPGREAEAGHAGDPDRGVPACGKEKDAGESARAGDAGRREYGIAVDIGTTTLAMSLVKPGRRDGRESGMPSPTDQNRRRKKTADENPVQDDPDGRERSDGAGADSGKKQINVVTSVNHQRMYGADVISRIQAANEGDGPHLRELIRRDLERMAEELCESAGITAAQVGRIVIAGNTTMCHLLRGLSCETLGAAPFTPAEIALWSGAGERVLGDWAAGAECVVLPGISAFTGADIVAGIYACRLERADEPVLFLDIGTNGEMAIGDRSGFLVTSAAAGPVFEGGNISCGVPGIPGAVTHVRLKRQSAEPERAGSMPGEGSPYGEEALTGEAVRWETTAGEYRCSVETIGGRPPVGLCGTGLIDAVGALVREGLIDENGTLSEPWFETGFPVAGEEIRLTQRDIREIQMGKAAIRAGIETLLEEYRKRRQSSPGGEIDIPGQRTADRDIWEDLRVCIAGGFGYDMDVEHAIAIGLFPEKFRGRVTAVGNSSLKGAERFLTDPDGERALGEIMAHAQEIGLASHPRFHDRYIECMFF